MKKIFVLLTVFVFVFSSAFVEGDYIDKSESPYNFTPVYDDRYWQAATSQTGLTGDKTGSFNLSSTGNWDIGGAVGVRASAVSGVLTITGIGNTNNENLLIDFETNPNYITITTTTGMTHLQFNIPGIQLKDGQKFYFGNSDDTEFSWATAGNDNFQLGLTCGSATDSGYFSIMERGDINTANRSPLATSVDPVFRVYSADATSATDYIEMYHNQTNAVINSGTGTIDLLATNLSTTGIGTFGTLKIPQIGGTAGKYSIFQGGANTIDLTYTLPTAYPAVSGYVLSATNAGVMSWIAAGGAEADTLASVMARGATTGIQLASTLAIGTSPFSITSTTVNTNLNADLLDGQHGTVYAPTGMISAYGGTSAPTGWLMCDSDAGSRTTYSRTTYAALYAVIGDAFGSGDGSTTFNVPLIPTETFLTGVNIAGVGATGGSATHSHNGSGNSVDTNSANISDSGHTHDMDLGSPGNALAAGTDYNTPTLSANSDVSDSGHEHTLGSGTTITDSQSLVPPNLRVNWIIKY